MGHFSRPLNLVRKTGRMTMNGMHTEIGHQGISESLALPGGVTTDRDDFYERHTQTHRIHCGTTNFAPRDSRSMQIQVLASSSPRRSNVDVLFLGDKQMTPTQRKQLAQILLKEGEEGWRIECKRKEGDFDWRYIGPNHQVDCMVFIYRAVRIERTPTRTPFPIEHYRRGMEVKSHVGLAEVERLVVGLINGCIILETADLTHVKMVSHWRWPNETEWKPAYTETIKEKIVETLVVEGL